MLGDRQVSQPLLGMAQPVVIEHNRDTSLKRSSNMKAIDMVVLKNKKQYERADFNKKDVKASQAISPKREAETVADLMHYMSLESLYTRPLKAQMQSQGVQAELSMSEQKSRSHLSSKEYSFHREQNDKGKRISKFRSFFRNPRNKNVKWHGVAKTMGQRVSSSKKRGASMLYKNTNPPLKAVHYAPQARDLSRTYYKTNMTKFNARQVQSTSDLHTVASPQTDVEGPLEIHTATSQMFTTENPISRGTESTTNFLGAETQPPDFRSNPLLKTLIDIQNQEIFEQDQRIKQFGKTVGKPYRFRPFQKKAKDDLLLQRINKVGLMKEDVNTQVIPNAYATGISFHSHSEKERYKKVACELLKLKQFLMYTPKHDASPVVRLLIKKWRGEENEGDESTVQDVQAKEVNEANYQKINQKAVESFIDYLLATSEEKILKDFSIQNQHNSDIMSNILDTAETLFQQDPHTMFDVQEESRPANSPVLSDPNHLLKQSEKIKSKIGEDFTDWNKNYNEDIMNLYQYVKQSNVELRHKNRRILSPMTKHYESVKDGKLSPEDANYILTNYIKQNRVLKVEEMRCPSLDRPHKTGVKNFKDKFNRISKNMSNLKRNRLLLEKVMLDRQKGNRLPDSNKDVKHKEKTLNYVNVASRN